METTARRNPLKHNWIKIFYIITAIIGLTIEIYQRISVNIFYTSYTYTYYHVPSINRYPTELTASNTSITWIWYIVYIWQSLSLIYSVIGIFRRTSQSSYFYLYPCAINTSIYFYITLAYFLHIPIFFSAINNTYSALISVIRYISTFFLVLYVFIIVNSKFKSNLQHYFRNHYVVDVWLVRILYQNGCALWSGILFYESCLSITIALIYTSELSSSTAYLIGSSLFLLGLILLFIYENFLYQNHLPFVLAHWLMFYWLIWDIQYTVQKKFFLSLYTVTLIPLTYYVITFCIVGRMISFFTFCRERYASRAYSGRVYTLIDQPQQAF